MEPTHDQQPPQESADRPGESGQIQPRGTVQRQARGAGYVQRQEALRPGNQPGFDGQQAALRPVQMEGDGGGSSVLRGAPGSGLPSLLPSLQPNFAVLESVDRWLESHRLDLTLNTVDVVTGRLLAAVPEARDQFIDAQYVRAWAERQRIPLLGGAPSAAGGGASFGSFFDSLSGLGRFSASVGGAEARLDLTGLSGSLGYHLPGGGEARISASTSGVEASVGDEQGGIDGHVSYTGDSGGVSAHVGTGRVTARAGMEVRRGDDGTATPAASAAVEVRDLVRLLHRSGALSLSVNADPTRWSVSLTISTGTVGGLTQAAATRLRETMVAAEAALREVYRIASTVSDPVEMGRQIAEQIDPIRAAVEAANRIASTRTTGTDWFISFSAGGPTGPTAPGADPVPTTGTIGAGVRF